MIPHVQDDASSTQRLEGVTSSKLTKVSKVSPDGSSKVNICNIQSIIICNLYKDYHFCHFLGSSLMAGVTAEV